MAKTFTPITTSNLANQSSITAAIDLNFAALTALLVDVYSLKGDTPNQLKSNLDCNGNAILNMSAPVSINSPARLVDVVSNPTLQVPPVGTSGATVPLLNAANTWSGLQLFSTGPEYIGAQTAGIITDGYQGFSAQTNTTTASNIYSGVVPPTWFYNDVIRSVAVATAGSTVINVSNYGGYLLNNNASTGLGQNAVSYFSLGISAVDNAHTWGLNQALTDTTNNTPLATTGRQLIGAEFDFNVYSNNGGTVIEGTSYLLFANTAGQYGNAVQVGLSGGSGTWTNALVINDGACGTAGIIVGATSSGASANTASMFINLGLRDSTAQGQYLQLSGIPITTNAALKVASNILANYIVLETAGTGSSPSIFIGGSDTNINFLLAAKGTGTINTLSSVIIDQTTAIPAGGTNGLGLMFSSTSSFGVFFGSGAPTLTAAKGSLYLRSDGSSTTTRAYINTDSGTTWTAISTVA